MRIVNEEASKYPWEQLPCTISTEKYVKVCFRDEYVDSCSKKSKSA